MKILVHKMSSVDINIFKWDGNIIEGSFFRDKPEVDDLIMSFTKGDVNFLYLYKIVEILECRDSNVSTSNFNGKNAFFKLKIELLNDENFNLPAQYQNIDTSRKSNY